MREHGFCAVTLFAKIKLLSHFLTQSVQETDSKGSVLNGFPQAQPMEHAGTDLDS
jgi:hypothetical protein